MSPPPQEKQEQKDEQRQEQRQEPQHQSSLPQQSRTYEAFRPFAPWRAPHHGTGRQAYIIKESEDGEEERWQEWEEERGEEEEEEEEGFELVVEREQEDILYWISEIVLANPVCFFFY